MIFDTAQPDLLARGLLLAPAALLWSVLLVRCLGLRSLSKMTPFDFAMTIAIGSLIAGAAQADSWEKFLQPGLAMGALFATQGTVSFLRRKYRAFRSVIQNRPVVLMRDGTFDHAVMRAARVTRGDILAKLREANVQTLSAVRAVVLETTGDVSVLHGEGGFDDDLLELR